MSSNSIYSSTKKISLGSCAFRQWRATHSHCSKIHGYELQAKFWFAGPFLDGRNWIIDFGELDELKNKLNSIFDHTLCVAADDPFLEDFKDLHMKGVVDVRIFEAGVGIERVAEVCFNVVTEYLQEKYGNLRWVDKVEVFEHDRNSAIFYNPKFVDNSLAATSPTEAATIVEQYLKNEAQKAKTDLGEKVERMRDEIKKDFESPVAVDDVPTNEEIDQIIEDTIIKETEKLEAEAEIKTTATNESIPVTEVESPAPTEPVNPPGTGAPVGPRPTTGGYSDLFKGTRWG